MQNNNSEFLPFLAIRHFRNERKAEPSQLSQRLLGVLLIGQYLTGAYPINNPRNHCGRSPLVPMLNAEKIKGQIVIIF